MSQINKYPVPPASIQTPPAGYKAFFLDSTNNNFATLMDESRALQHFTRDLLNGAGVPSSGVGSEGYFYIDTSNMHIYGPKSGTNWGSPTSLIGPAGPQGIQGNDGPAGPAGTIGPEGPAGPVDLVFIGTDTSTITLPDTTIKTAVKEFDVNFPVNGDYVATCTLSMKGHSTGNDMEFEWRLSGSAVGPDFIEEMKDTNNNARNIRSWQFDLGTQVLGTKTFDLYFSKESTGGTARLHYISLFVWRVS